MWESCDYKEMRYSDLNVVKEKNELGARKNCGKPKEEQKSVGKRRMK